MYASTLTAVFLLLYKRFAIQKLKRSRPTLSIINQYKYS